MYFRPKSGHSNERIHRKPIDRGLRTLLNEGSGSFYDGQLLSYGSFSRTSSAVFGMKRKHKYEILKFFSKRFHNLKKELENTVSNTVAIDVS